MEQSYYGHGKLLISAEYGVLDGALALTLPTRTGQELTVSSIEGSGLEWESLDWRGNTWYKGAFAVSKAKVVALQQDPVSQMLEQLLNTARKLNPGFPDREHAFKVTTRLEFPRNWGLGSSSTLVYTLSQWSGTNPYVLLEKSFGGSGYDIAAAASPSALLYRRTPEGPVTTPVQLDWPFKDQLFFVHLNRKQDSREAISNYREKGQANTGFIESLNRLSREMVGCTDIGVMNNLMGEHEQLVSRVIDAKTVKDQYFPDYPHAIKSLGGWGGDFIMAIGNKDDRLYFAERGYHTLVPFDKMIL